MKLRDRHAMSTNGCHKLANNASWLIRCMRMRSEQCEDSLFSHHALGNKIKVWIEQNVTLIDC